jgi:hypothetical protein
MGTCGSDVVEPSQLGSRCVETALPAGAAVRSRTRAQTTCFLRRHTHGGSITRGVAVARIARVQLLGLTLLCAACGSRSGENSVSGQVPVTTGSLEDGGGTGSAPSCATLLPVPVRPEVFVLPQDSWVQGNQGNLTCRQGTSDSLGNRAFSVQTYGTSNFAPPGEARLYVIDPASGTIQVDDVAGERDRWASRSRG